MKSPLTERLEQELAEITAEYEACFAGKPRNRCSPEAMTALIGKTGELLARIDEIALVTPGDEGQLQALRQAAAESLRTYETEHTAILEAQEAGPDFEEFAQLAGLANFVFARYHRHFAGQSRLNRDLGLLDEMIAELEGIGRRMEEILARQEAPSLRRDLGLVRHNLGLYARERVEIASAQLLGTAAEQANTLAGLANGQFRLYKDHFANHSRLTRRPALLERMIESLGRVAAGMAKLKVEGLGLESNDRNLGIVQNNLRMYRTELAEVRRVRQEVSLPELMDLLGEEANEIFAEYEKNFAGKGRGAVDLGLLSTICDQLGEVCRQMVDLCRFQVPGLEEGNLDVVMQSLGAFEREYELIEGVQRKDAGRVG